MSKTKATAIGIAVVLLLGLLAWPVKYLCPLGPCTTAPDVDGYVYRYYEIQPLGAPLIESLTSGHRSLAYSSGVQKDKP